jgi:hypothetical protein
MRGHSPGRLFERNLQNFQSPRQSDMWNEMIWDVLFLEGRRNYATADVDARPGTSHGKTTRPQARVVGQALDWGMTPPRA